MTPERMRLAEYLLGSAPAEEAARITEQLFEDEAFPEELEEVARDLVDAYAHGKLSGADALALEAAAQRSASLREKMRFARSLAGMPKAAGGVLRYWMAAAAAVLVMLSGAAIVRLIATNSRLQSELATVRGNSRPERLDRPSTMAFMITPLERGAGAAAILPISNPAVLVRLNFAIEMEAGAQADIRIRTQAGALVFEQRGVAPAGVVIGVWIEAKDLPPGSYSAAITERDGRQVNYAFEVIRNNF